jgi:phage terminase large subunit-like protein
VGAEADPPRGVADLHRDDGVLLGVGDGAHADPEIAARDGFRRFRTSYVEVPRKNAKSTLTSGIGLYMLAIDGEGGAECYSAATTRDQAKIVWSDARTMALRCEEFAIASASRSRARDHRAGDASKFIPLAAEDGLARRAQHPLRRDRRAPRAQDARPLRRARDRDGRAHAVADLAITTAGSNRAGICYEQRTYLTKLLQGVAQDESFFGIIYTIDDGDDWTDPAVWAKANPNYGVSVFPDDIARLCRKAQEMPSAQGNFLTKRLNVWVNADTTWMDMRAWDKCADETLSIDAFEGERCIDRARSRVEGRYCSESARVQPIDRRNGTSTRSGATICPKLQQKSPEFAVFGLDRDRSDRHDARQHHRFRHIEAEILDDAKRFELAEVAYDPFQATQLSTHLAAEGLTLVEMRPIVLNFSEPMKELEALVLAGRFHHDGDPVLAWMVSNVVCHRDRRTTSIRGRSGSRTRSTASSR